MRAFFSIEIPEGLKKTLTEASKELIGQGVVTVRNSAMHITLLFLGEINETQLEKIKAAMPRVDGKKFTVHIRGLATFTPKFPRIIFAQIKEGREEMAEICSKLSAIAIGASADIDREDFFAHATIARVNSHKAISRALLVLLKYKSFDFGSFEVGSISLMKSSLTASGPVYEELYKHELE